MKKVLIGAALLIVAALFIVLPTANNLALEHQKVERSYAEVQNALQRQADLLPNLAGAAKAYATHEQTTFKEIAEGRGGVADAAKAANAIKPSDLANNPEAQKQFAAAVAAQQAALLNFRSTVEAYPQLQANDNFKTLMVEIEGSQNRIVVARRRNQDAVNAFNIKVVTYPAKAVAAIAGYHELPYFKADADAQKAPKLF